MRFLLKMVISSAVTDSKKSVLIEYGYWTIEVGYVSTTIQFSKVEVGYQSRISVGYYHF